MEIVVFHGVAAFVGEQIIIDERLGGFAGELHHHACRCVGIHVGVLARNIIILDVDDFEEHVARLRLSGDGALVAVCDVLLCYVFARTLHEFHFHRVLDVFHGHLCLSVHCDIVRNLLDETLVVTLLRVEHGLTDGGHDFLLVESYDSSVALNNCLYHFRI